MNAAAPRIAPNPTLCNAIARIPELQERLDAGQKFNAYERVNGGFFIGLGPIDNFERLAVVSDEELADIIVDALRVAVGQPPCIVTLSGITQA